MKRRGFIRIVALLIVGAILGPIVFAGLLAAYDARTGTFRKYQAADALREAVQRRTPDDSHDWVRDPMAMAETCGYDAKTIQDGTPLSPYTQPWHPKQGYFFLMENLAISLAGERREIEGGRLERSTSIFERLFLRRCIEGTALSPVCLAGARKILAAPAKENPETIAYYRLVEDRYQKISCGYLGSLGIPKTVPARSLRPASGHVSTS